MQYAVQYTICLHKEDRTSDAATSDIPLQLSMKSGDETSIEAEREGRAWTSIADIFFKRKIN